MNQERKFKKESLQIVSLCIPRDLVAKIDDARGGAESRSSAMRRILGHMVDNPPGMGTPPRLHGVVTTSAALPAELIVDIDRARINGESRSKCVTKLIQFFFGF